MLLYILLWGEHTLLPLLAKLNQVHLAGIKNHAPLMSCLVFSHQWFNRHIRWSVSAIVIGWSPHSESQAFNGTTTSRWRFLKWNMKTNANSWPWYPPFSFLVQRRCFMLDYALQVINGITALLGSTCWRERINTSKKSSVICLNKLRWHCRHGATDLNRW